MRAGEGASSVSPREAPFDLSGLDLPHPAPFLCDIRVAGSDLSGVIDHVSNIQYLRWLDRAAELHSDALGHTRPQLLAGGLMWFVARHEIDYLEEAWGGDELVLATWVRDMRRVRSWRDSIIIRPADRAVVCRASTLWVLVNLSTRRPATIPAAFVECFQPLQQPGRVSARASRPCTSP